MHRGIASLVALTLLTVGAGGGAAAPEPPSCAWAFRLDTTLANTLYPDSAASYWVLALPAAPGAQLEIRGRYPYGRYMSFTSYNVGLQSADGLADVRIAPEPGSTNPFGAGGDRYAEHRAYTVHVVFGQRPAHPAPNTLYTTNEAGTKTGVGFVVAYRVYQPDAGADERGGTALPSVSYVPPDGPRVDLPRCPYPQPIGGAANQVVAELGLPWPAGLPGAGTDPPVWHRFYNSLASGTQLTDNPATGEAIADGLAPLTRQLPQGGFLDNPDNAYVYTLLAAGRGELAVVRGRLPTTPRTYPNSGRMSHAQLRYWSLCSYDVATERFYGCVMDDQVPVDRQGRFTVVVSTPALRPQTARVECGRAWLPAGPLPQTLLVLRNMLPHPAFANAVQKTPHDDEVRGMGPYYPVTVYSSGRDVDAPGCRRG